MKASDAGSYTVLASNSVGQAESMAAINVKGKDRLFTISLWGLFSFAIYLKYIDRKARSKPTKCPIHLGHKVVVIYYYY